MDDEAFANMPRPQSTSDPASVPMEASAGQTHIPQPSVWTGPKRIIAAINQHFKEHPFWGEPVDPPPAIVVVFRRLGARIGKIGRSCACGALGPVERSSRSGLKSENKATVLNEKVPVTGKCILNTLKSIIPILSHNYLFLSQMLHLENILHQLMIKIEEFPRKC